MNVKVCLNLGRAGWGICDGLMKGHFWVELATAMDGAPRLMGLSNVYKGLCKKRRDLDRAVGILRNTAIRLAFFGDDFAIGIWQDAKELYSK